MAVQPPIRFHVVIPVHNRVSMTLRVLACLANQTYATISVYVIDDGSTDGTAVTIRERFSGRLDLRVLTGDGNLWWGGAMAKGMAEAALAARHHDVATMLNNDVTFGPTLFEDAAQFAIEDRHTVFGALVIDSRSKRVAKSGTIIKSWPLAVNYNPHEGLPAGSLTTLPAFTSTDYLRGVCTFIPMAVVRRIGIVDSRRFPHYHGDTEYTLRAKRSGCRVGVHRDLHVYHVSESTGAFNAPTPNLTIGQFARSLFSIQSPNCLKYKLRFGVFCCPPAHLAPFILTDTAKVILRSILMILAPESYGKLKELSRTILDVKPIRIRN